MSTASNFVELYSSAVISTSLRSVSTIDITLNKSDSSFVFPVARAALERIQTCSLEGADENAEDTVIVFPELLTALTVFVSV